MNVGFCWPAFGFGPTGRGAEQHTTLTGAATVIYAGFTAKLEKRRPLLHIYIPNGNAKVCHFHYDGKRTENCVIITTDQKIILFFVFFAVRFFFLTNHTILCRDQYVENINNSMCLTFNEELDANRGKYHLEKCQYQLSN